MATSAESAERVEAMLLEALYLKGAFPAKDHYLSLFASANEEMDDTASQEKAMSAVNQSILRVFPLSLWQEQRLNNYSYLAEKLGRIKGLKILSPAKKDECPFSCVILVDSRKKMIKSSRCISLGQ